MIHDLDIVQQILGEEPERIEAIGVTLRDRPDRPRERPARVSLGLHREPDREPRLAAPRSAGLRFFPRDGCVSIDFLARSVAILQLSVDEPGAPPRLATERLAFDPADALLAQLEEFVSAIRTRKAPVVSGREGLRALRTALRVLEAMPRFGDPD